MRRTANFLGIGVVLSLAGCGRSETGVHIHARLGSLEYDELQFRVTRAGGEVVVDPATAGRYQGPFQPGDQDVLVYLRDDLDGSQLHCEVSALRAGAVVGTGAGDVIVVRGDLKDVDIFMSAPPGMPNGELCAVSPAGTTCAAAGCADDGKSAVPAGSCDGAGKCVIPAKIRCGKDATCVDGVCVDAKAPKP